MPKLAGLREQRHQPRYDSLVRDDAVTTVQQRTNLFQGLNLGQIARTNMEISSTLPSDNTAVILALRTWMSFADNTIYDPTIRGLFFTFVVAEKDQFQSPIWYVPGGGGVFGHDVNTGAHHVTNGMPSHEAILKLAKPVLIPARQQFKWVMNFEPFATEDILVTINALTTAKCIVAMLDIVETRDVL